ncbi:MAG: terminase small subunit [Oscillospiraceae bacterium]|nr:terminase small subunit [Oscillospiraceae bacterium]
MAGRNKQETGLKSRIRQGRIRREDVTRRLAELAFGQPNDCVRLALEEVEDLEGLDLSLLSEIKRSEKGMVEIKLIDRLRALEQLAQAAGEDRGQVEEFLKALGSAGEGS